MTATIQTTQNNPKSINPGIERILGLYEGELLRLCRRQNISGLDKALYRFFGTFPEKSFPDDFSVLDVNFYVNSRRIEGDNEASINKDIKYVRAFFEYCIDYLDYHFPNPASLRRPSLWRKLRNNKKLSPHEYDEIGISGREESP